MNEIITTNQANIIKADDPIEQLVKATNATLTSQHSKRAYERVIRDFAASGQPMTAIGITTYRDELPNSESTKNHRTYVLKTVARVALQMRWLDPNEYQYITAIKALKANTEAAGYWLEKEQVSELIKGCPNDMKGKRDKALISLLITTGLRRDEASRVTWEQVQKKGKKWFLWGIDGKGRKIRNIPIMKDAVPYILEWREEVKEALGAITGPVFKTVRRGGHIKEKGITGKAIRKIIAERGKAILDIELATHDLRRTFAYLMYEGGQDIRTIQTSLGHANIATTERYLKPIVDALSMDDNAITL